jgi:hypothetical protein
VEVEHYAHLLCLSSLGRPSEHRARKTLQTLERRLLGASPLRDDSDTGYFTNITLGGVVVEVEIDTGRQVHD